MEKLSVCITTYNSERTLAACLESVKWADEIVVLDSLSTDRTLEIAHGYDCRVQQQAFLGYSKQKQMVIDLAAHRWVLLLDSDEVLSKKLQSEICALLRAGFKADGYEMPRLEQVFWRMSHPGVRMNRFLRLFDKTRTRMSTHTMHESPQVQGVISHLHAPLLHYGETDITTKISKINAYSSGVAQDKFAQGRRAQPWIMLLYPPFAFLRLYFFKRNFLNGWAGVATSLTGAFYAFLKYAKLYEAGQFERRGRPEPGKEDVNGKNREG